MPAVSKQSEKRPIAKLIFSSNTLICCVLGFSSGLPLFILINLVPLWMREQKVDLSTIGLFSLVMFPYTWKFLWAPFLDAVFFRKFGRRRTWMLATQVPLMAGVAFLAFCDPVAQLSATAAVCVVIAILSATQDIVIDAYRREILSDRELGFGNSVHVNFYRLSALVPGSLALILSDYMPWKPVFLMVAAFMLPGIVLTLCVREPSNHSGFKSLKSTIVDPFRDFFSRKGWKGVGLFLGFLFLYKLGDSMATALISPFYYDIGFSKTEIGSMAKIIGTVSTVIGAFAGGIIMMRSGINKALYWFGYVQLVTILGFAWLALAGRDLSVLAVAVTGEYLGVGLGTGTVTLVRLAVLVALVADSFLERGARLGFRHERIVGKSSGGHGRKQLSAEFPSGCHFACLLSCSCLRFSSKYHEPCMMRRFASSHTASSIANVPSVRAMRHGHGPPQSR